MIMAFRTLTQRDTIKNKGVGGVNRATGETPKKNAPIVIPLRWCGNSQKIF